MFGFPPILDGNAGVKMTNNADSGFPKPGIREIFYSIKDGNWNDITIWQTASGRVGVFPTANDDVYIRHVVIMNVTTTINNLFISNQLLIGTTISINNIQSTGILDMQSNGSALNISGNNNRIDRLIIPTGIFVVNSSIINYTGSIDQTILPLTYHSLSVSNRGVKSVIADLTINRNLSTSAPNIAGGNTSNDFSGAQNAILDLGAYSLIVNGTTLISNNSYLRKYNSEGNLLFVGSLTFGGSGTQWGLPDFQGNINVELRGGLTNSGAASAYGGVWNTGTGTWTFTTNNQTVTHNAGSITYTNKFIIEAGRTITVSGNSIWILNDTIDGAASSSSLVMGSAGTLYFGTQTAAENSMVTGTFNTTTNANTVGYVGNYSCTIPSLFPTFHSLTISGTGTKTLGVNTTLNGNLLISSTVSATDGLDTSIYNLFVSGTSQFTTLTASGAGNITFVGAVNISNGLSQLWRGFNFGGNPNVEFRNGATFTNNRNLVMGTGNYTFTTNSQTLSITNANALFPNGTITGNITLTFNANETASGFNTNPNGTVAGSTLRNQGTIRLNGLPSGVMTTGVFDVTTFSSNVVLYGFNGNDTLPLTTYAGLTIAGTGTKTLIGTTTLNSNLSITAGVLECSTFNFTVTGTTGVGADAKLSKNNTGNIIFIGSVTSNAQSSVIPSFDFSGNPNIEFRNGLSLTNNAATNFISGTGAFTFSTNNQNLDIVNRTNATFNCAITISNNIILTYTNSGGTGFPSGIIITGILNGGNAASTFRIAANGTTNILITNYQNTTQPMATGVLDTSTNLNTFIYGAGNQNVKGGTPQQYRNLRFSGSGTTKTLQGNINVQNTYTVDAGVTVNLNGFTKTP